MANEPTNLFDDVRCILIDEIELYEDSSICGCDLADEVLSRYNIDGTYFYNRQKAWEYIFENRMDYIDIENAIKKDLGNYWDFTEFFENPESWHVSRMIYVARHILSPILEELEWYDDTRTLDTKLIKKLQKALKDDMGNENIF